MSNKIPGVYMIRNKITGKIYIGQSNDIPKRWKHYAWAATSSKDYVETTRPLVVDMRNIGMDNFEFSILDSSDAMADRDTRLAREAMLIEYYHATDPDVGYNLSEGYESIRYGSDVREQRFLERIKRAYPVFLHDTVTGNTLLYYTGAKGVGEDFGYGKDVMSHTVSRGSLFNDRYYIIPARYDDRHKVLEKLRVKKTENTDQLLRAQSHSRNAFNKYAVAVAYIDLIAEEWYGFTK